MEQISLFRCALMASAASCVLAVTDPARAGGHAAVDLDTCFPMDQSGPVAGLGASLRLGWRFAVGPAWIGPEVGGSYTAYLGRGENEYSTSSGRISHGERLLGGVRFGLGGRVQPSVHARFGLGWIRGATPGPAFDGGAAVDFALVPRLLFGVHAGYNVISVWHAADTSDPVSPRYFGSLDMMRWVSAGLHVGVGF